MPSKFLLSFFVSSKCLEIILLFKKIPNTSRIAEQLHSPATIKYFFPLHAASKRKV